MKKLLSLTLILVLLVPCVAYAESTSVRYLVEFSELYAKRLAEYSAEAGIDFELSIYAALPPSRVGDYLVFESSAGSIGVYPASYAIHDVTMTFYSLSDDDSDNELYAR